MTGFFGSWFKPQRTTFFGTPIDDGEYVSDPDGGAPVRREPASDQMTMNAVLPRPTTPASTPEERAHVILGETAGLYPQSVNPDVSPRDPSNWVTGSADELARARRYVGIVAGRNAVTRPATPDLSNSIEKQAWEAATTAATAAQENPAELDPRIGQFYIRREGDDRQPFPDSSLYLSVGPFRNIGGRGSTGVSNNTVIEFYGKKKSR